MPTVDGFVDGFDALPLGAFSALGLRVSRLDFFWLFAMVLSLEGRSARMYLTHLPMQCMQALAIRPGLAYLYECK